MTKTKTSNAKFLNSGDRNTVKKRFFRDGKKN